MTIEEKSFLIIEGTVNEIVSVLCDRSGFDDWWHNLDIETRIEIRNELRDVMLPLEKFFVD